MMPIKLFLGSAIVLTSFAFTACSDDDKEQARVTAAAVVITHNSSECPKVSGVYKRKEGFAKGVMGFTISDNGTKLNLANSATGWDGHTFIIDGKQKEEQENNKPLRYVAGCDSGKLRLVGSIGDGQDKLDLTISEKDGGTIVVKDGDAEGEYEQVVGQ
jgi:hypothetical protein